MMIKICNQLIWWNARVTSKDLVIKTEEIKFDNIIKQHKMIIFDDVTKENINEHNLNWPQITDHPYRILITQVRSQGRRE